MNDRYDAILRLRALRAYRDEPVPDAVMTQILEAARWTGSAKNLQNWSFILVTDPEQKARLAECGDFTTPMRDAPAAIALIQEPDGYEFDTGRVAQNIMLAADALGLATCPVTLHRDDEAGAVLELPPGARCRYAVAVGLPAAEGGPMNWGGRKPLDSLVYRDRYGRTI